MKSFRTIMIEALGRWRTPFLGAQILLLGGNGDKETPSSDIFLLDYTTKKWTKLAYTMPHTMYSHATVIVNDELYIIGGFTNDEDVCCHGCFRLNKNRMMWEQLPFMNEPRSGLTNSCVVYNDCIWVFGGFSVKNTTSEQYSNMVEMYDPKDNKWHKKRHMTRKIAHATAAVVKDKIYLCGGHDGRRFLNHIDVYDPASNTWAFFCSLPEPRSKMTAVVDEANIVLIGGEYGFMGQTTVWKLNVENKEWIHLPHFFGRRQGLSVVGQPGGEMLLIGGTDEYGKNDRVEKFDGEKWTEFSPLPEGRLFHTCTVLTQPMMTAFGKYHR